MTVISKLGPGLWFSIHFQAIRAVTPESKLHFAEYINQLLTNFPCQACVEHFRKYLSAHPLIYYWHLELGMFKWSVEFHNSVNQRLGKTEMIYSEALGLYQNPEPCSSCIKPYNGSDTNTDQTINDDVIIDMSDVKTVPITAVPHELLTYLAGK